MENTSDNFFSFLPKDCGQTHPWLLVSQGKYLQSHTFCNISNHEYIERDIPEFRNKQVSATSYGWLLLIDYSSVPFDCILVNTTSKERVQLPSIEFKPGMGIYCRCILSNPPTDSNCHVLLITCSTNLLLFCRIGDKKFIKRTRQFGDDYLKEATNFMGKLYAWMCESGNFVEVDFVGQDIVLNQIVNDKGQFCRILCPSPSNSLWIKDFIFESCGELLFVHVIGYHHSREIAYFRIFRVKTLENECEELRNIGDRTIFFCPFGSMSLSCTNRSGLKRNSIYYTGTGTKLFVYDIEDRSKTLSKLCPSKSDSPGFGSWLLL